MLFGIIVCTFLLYIAGANTVNISSISVYCGNHLSQWQIIIQASKSLNMDIMWEVHKRTQQEVSAKLESYIYKVHMVHATNNYACPVKIVDGRLCFYFLFFLNFIFCFLFFSFSIFKTTRVSVYQSRCHISHKLMA